MASAAEVDPELSIHLSVEVEIETQSGVYYQLQGTEDLNHWVDLGEPFRGQGVPVSRHVRVDRAVRFMRAVPTEPHPSVQEEIIFQHSTLGALGVGVFEGDLDFRSLLQHGDFGVGTFDGVDGELIIVDGTAYRARVDGALYEVPMDEKTPFAVVTHFETDLRIELSNITNFDDFRQQLDAQLDSVNRLYALRITGTFDTLKIRSVPAQTPPYPTLGEVVALQTEFEHTAIQGTMTGFRLPSYVSEINAAGHHLHFVDAARSLGGHVLDFSATQLIVEVDISRRLEIDIPSIQPFLDADLE